MADDADDRMAAAPVYDVFLSYHWPDREAVERVRHLLEARGITTFMDRYQLTAGLQWGPSLQRALQGARAVAVFLGPGGLGTWQTRETWFALDRQANEDRHGRHFPVVPVLLPAMPPSDLTTGFLFQNTWIDLRGNVADPDAIDMLARAIRGTEEPALADRRSTLCPYLGLGAFQEQHAALFYGRERFTDKLAEAVLSRSLVAVVGPSGSGKSSVVRAGLLPRLRRRRPPDPTWDAITFTPRNEPFHRMAAALIVGLEPGLSKTDQLAEARKLGEHLATGTVPLEDVIRRLLEDSNGTDRLLLTVDQFEELFTLASPRDQARFAEPLLAALDKVPMTLVLTLRADFYGHAIDLNRDLSDRLERGLVNLGPMTRSELERAIVEPARRVGMTFEAGLVQRILEDVEAEPGSLPLLEFALTELWAHAQGGPLSHTAYEAIGEVAGAVAQRADATLAAFTPDQQAVARRIFTRLVRVARPGEGAEDTRQRASLSDLADGPDAEQVRAVIRELTADRARLLVTDGDAVDVVTPSSEKTVEVAHEALIQQWGCLRQWLNEDREFLLWRQRLRVGLAEWERNGADAGALLRGAPLADGERWLASRPNDLNAEERAYIRASSEFRERSRRRTLALSLATATVGVLLAVFAGWQWRQVEQQRALAEEQRALAVRRFGYVKRLANVDLTPTFAGLSLLDLVSGQAPPASDRNRLLDTADLFSSRSSLFQPTPASRQMRQNLDALARDAEGDLEIEAELVPAYIRVGDLERWESRPLLPTTFTSPFIPLRPTASPTPSPNAGLESYQRAQSIGERVARADPTNTRTRRDVSVSLQKIGQVFEANGDKSGAMDQYRQALAILAQLALAAPNDLDAQRDLDAIYTRIGVTQQSVGDITGALESYRQVLAIRQRIADATQQAGARRDVAAAHTRIGSLKRTAGDLPGALEAYRQALAIREVPSATQGEADEAPAQRELAATHATIGEILEAAGDRAGALASYGAALAIREDSPAIFAGQAEQETTDRIRRKVAELRGQTTSP